MNSDEKRLLRHLESYNLDHPTLYTYIYNYYTPSRLADRLLTPGFLIPLALLAALLYHHFTSESTGLESLPHLLWDTLVRITPARLLYAVDTWLHPPLFPPPMLQTTQTRTTSHAAKSEVLRRVLGMDKAGRRSLSGLSPSSMLLKGDPDKPAGLGNTSNSCYQNSVLQGLASLRPLRTYLASVDAQLASDKKAAGTVATLRELVADLHNPSNNGRTLWTPSVLKSMSTWQQQDAQEYFSKLLDQIDREMSRLLTPFPKPTGFEGGSPPLSPSSKDDAAASQHSDDSGYQSLSTHSKPGSGCSDHPRPRAPPARNPLEGLQAQRVACTACGHSDGLSLIPFNCLTLNLGTDGRSHDLYERLDSYTRVEPIAGVECAKCTLLKYRTLLGKLIAGAEAQGKTEAQFPEPFARLRAIDAALEGDEFDDATLVGKCKIRPEHKVSSTKTKQAVVARPPQSLVVHMNRSVFDERTGRMWKNLAAVRFPAVLDLGPWCLGSARGGAPAECGDEEERWLLDPRESMVAGAEGRSKIVGPMYELRAVITHYGRHENGHYVCYRRHARGKGEERPARLAGEEGEVDEVDGVAGLEGGDAGEGDAEGRQQEEGAEESQWWRLSDQDVTKVDEETVLAQSGVFMLFYDCVDPNSTLASEVEQFVDSVSLQGVDGGQNDALGVPDATEYSEMSVKGVQEDKSGPAPSGDGPEKPPIEASDSQPPAEDEKPRPPTRAEMIARAKVLFARTADRAAAVPLPDEDEDL